MVPTACSSCSLVDPDSHQSLVPPPAGANGEMESPFHHLPQVKPEE